MPRRREVPKRDILADPKYGSVELAKFMNVLMTAGKKSVAERIVYGAIDRMAEKTGRPAEQTLDLLTQALDNVKPMVEVKSRRVGGATYQVPIEVRAQRRQTLAMRWVIEAACTRFAAWCWRWTVCGGSATTSSRPSSGTRSSWLRVTCSGSTPMSHTAAGRT